MKDLSLVEFVLLSACLGAVLGFGFRALWTLWKSFHD